MLYKDEYNTKLRPEYEKSKSSVEKATQIKESIESVPEKYNEILKKYLETHSLDKQISKSGFYMSNDEKNFLLKNNYSSRGKL